MTFTAETLKRLNALQLPTDTVTAILEIFEDAREAKKSRKGGAADRAARGTRLPGDWVLPDEWRVFAVDQGLVAREIEREAGRFRDYWLAVPGAKGIKLDWFATWRTWIGRTCERLGREPARRSPQSKPLAVDWERILTLYARTNSWNPEHGPAPGKLQCRAPADLVEKILRRGG